MNTKVIIIGLHPKQTSALEIINATGLFGVTLTDTATRLLDEAIRMALLAISEVKQNG